MTVIPSEVTWGFAAGTFCWNSMAF